MIVGKDGDTPQDSSYTKYRIQVSRPDTKPRNHRSYSPDLIDA